MIDIKGYAAPAQSAPLIPYAFQRRDVGSSDLLVEILYCGICHSDLHHVDNDLGHSTYPIVPGHEIVGRVTRVGPAATRFRAGDLVGIGCIVDSCRHCDSCGSGHEQFCEEGFTSTFGGRERAGGALTQGGYSTHYVVDENYALRIPASLDPAAAAPLLCAGITTYAPLKRHGVGPGKRVGVVGLGGLGHLAIKIARALGATPVMITSTAGKAADARRLGAEEVILTDDVNEVLKHRATLDFILDTVSAAHDPNLYMQLLRREGVMCLVGMPEKPLPVAPGSLVFGQKSLTGSLIGGIAETQEMLDFCARHGIAADIEMIAIDRVNEAWKRIVRNDVKYRFVIDMATLG
jgi:uncharacterized zinc-type alcohol dehydrogenase-like protein